MSALNVLHLVHVDMLRSKLGLFTEKKVELTLYQTILCFDDPGERACWKHCCKRSNSL